MIPTITVIAYAVVKHKKYADVNVVISIVCDNWKCIQRFLGTGARSRYATHIIIM